MENTAALIEIELINTHDWEQLLSHAAREVFEMMIGIPLEDCDDPDQRQSGEFAAVIGLAGPINGVFAIRCEEKTARGITCGMLGVDAEAARAEVWDALGEVCNMIIGNFKSKTGRLGEKSVLSVPTVIHGHDYRVRPLVNGSIVQCRMKTADGVLSLRLDYKLV